MNKATERLKEIEERIKKLHNKGSLHGSLYLKESEELTILHYEKRGILLGIEETKKEYRNTNCTKHGLIYIYCDKCFKDFKKEYEQKLLEQHMELSARFSEGANKEFERYKKELIEKLKPKKLKVAVNTPMMMLKAGEYYKAKDVEEVLK